MPSNQPRCEELPFDHDAQSLRNQTDPDLDDRPANKAKPNTRFLGRIIKATTNHNEALRAKEVAEAQARLELLTTESKEKERKKRGPSLGDIRRRQLGDITSILAGGKPKRRTGEEDKTAEARTSAPESADKKPLDKDRHRKSGSQRHGDEDAKKDSRDRRLTREHRGDEREHGKHRHRDRSRSPECSTSWRKYRQRSPHNEDENNQNRSHSRKSRADAHRSGRDLLGDEPPKRSQDGRLTRNDDDVRSTRQTEHGRLSGKNQQEESEDSDPLDEFIGPVPSSQSCPVVRPRGRGATGARMDSRLSDSYDPKSDPVVDAEQTDDWAEAAEAFRDRQKWKQQGAERLRTAGFTEEQIKKWENQGPRGEKNLADVKWSKKGERREWDRGKEGVDLDTMDVDG